MPGIYHKLTINAPIENVFENITTQGGLAAWWTTDCDAAAVHGNVNIFRFGPDIVSKFKITQLHSPSSLGWKGIEGPPDWLGTNITFDLKSNGDKTILDFRHNDYPNLNDFFGTCSYQWAYYLHSLKTLCETGTGFPFDPS